MKQLRSGYSTGACAAAAARGAAMLLRYGEAPESVELSLPTGDRAVFKIHSHFIDNGSATCSVLKDAGDDPDVTNGAEIFVTAGARGQGPGAGIEIVGGKGVGRVTKPGLAVPVGEWAINPVPRRMIEHAVLEIFPEGGVVISVSISDGEERAKKTLNARLGIIGGLSILGTTGIVHPVSAKAWTDTIDSSLDVAKACGCSNVILCTGRTSEMAAMGYFKGQEEESFIMMGDHVAHAVQSCSNKGFNAPIIACQFAKLLKMACGHPNTHAAASELDLSRLAEWLEADGGDAESVSILKSSNTAREFIIRTGYDPMILRILFSKLSSSVKIHAPELAPSLLLCRYDNAPAIWFPHNPL